MKKPTVENIEVTETDVVDKTPITIRIRKSTLKKVATTTWKALIVVLLITIVGELNVISNHLYNIGSIAVEGFGLGDTSGSGTTTSLTGTTWYTQRLMGVVTKADLFSAEGKPLIIMFRKDNCSFCTTAEANLVTWLNAGNGAKVNFLFVDTDKNPSLVATDANAQPVVNPSATNFYVTGTPTFLYKDENGVYTVLVGVDALSTLLTKYATK
jgi:thioredoxin-related protein